MLRCRQLFAVLLYFGLPAAVHADGPLPIPAHEGFIADAAGALPAEERSRLSGRR
jgi:uncharacterized membrane protein YgcG